MCAMQANIQMLDSNEMERQTGERNGTNKYARTHMHKIAIDFNYLSNLKANL